MPHRRPTALAAASALALAGPLLLAVSPAAAAPPGPGSTRPATVAQAQREFEERTPRRYRDQDLTWAPCSSAQIGVLNALVGGLECAQVAVPRDWDAPAEGDPLQVTISRLPRTGARPGRTIVTNPGGPGGAGLTLAALGSSVPALAGTEVIGLDVRGTGASSSLTCGDDLLAAASVAPDYRDRSPEALALAAKSVQAGAEACADDPLVDVVNTRQTVFDVDLVRDALDRDTIDWVGYSGGTWLGTQFATHLPARVGRFVLDSTVDATAGYQEVFSYQPMAFQRRFEQDFAPWVAAGNAAHGLGATGAEVTATYERLRASVAARPIGVPGLALDGTLLDSLVLQAMYGKAQFPQAAWLLSAVQVVDALRGRGVRPGRAHLPRRGARPGPVPGGAVGGGEAAGHLRGHDVRRQPLDAGPGVLGRARGGAGGPVPAARLRAVAAGLRVLGPPGPDPAHRRRGGPAAAADRAVAPRPRHRLRRRGPHPRGARVLDHDHGRGRGRPRPLRHGQPLRRRRGEHLPHHRRRPRRGPELRGRRVAAGHGRRDAERARGGAARRAGCGPGVRPRWARVGEDDPVRTT